MDNTDDLPVAVLTRNLSLSGDDGTFGDIVAPSGLRGKTGELPNRDNKPDISCILAGGYLVEDAWSEKHQKNVWHIRNVQGRDQEEIHSGNLCGDVSLGFASDVLGCQIWGDSIAMFREGEVVEGHHLTRDQRGVTNTVATLAKFRAELGLRFWLEIKEA